MSESVFVDANEDASFCSIDLEPPKLLSVVSSCRICLSSMLDPARLVCGHKFCETCLNKYWNATEKPEFVVCPLCRNYAFKVGFVQKSEDATFCYNCQKDFLLETECILNTGLSQEIRPKPFRSGCK